MVGRKSQVGRRPLYSGTVRGVLYRCIGVMRYLSVALACALAACASGSGGNNPPPPPPKILLGAHVPWAQNAMTPVTAFETSLGRKLDIVKFYPSWPPWSAWDVSFAKEIVAHGAVP